MTEIRLSLIRGVYAFFMLSTVVALSSCGDSDAHRLTINGGDHIVFVGGNFCSRALNFGYFESALYSRYPEEKLIIRNMCDGGDTPGFRPHSARENVWAYPGANQYQDEYARDSKSIGDFPDTDAWLTSQKADIIIGFFGYSSSFNGPDGIDNFREELRGFLDHTLAQKYNGSAAPQVALVTSPALEDRSDDGNLPDGNAQNANIKLYADAMEEIATEYGVPFINTYDISLGLYKNNQLTIDGSQYNEEGYELISDIIFERLTGKKTALRDENKMALLEAVKEKNWMWHNDYKIPNGVHVYGRRFEPFGPDNYPYEIEKIRQLTTVRDSAIWATATGEQYDLKAADNQTNKLPQVETNYIIKEGDGTAKYLYGKDAENSLSTAPGYKMELFASEEEFPDLANPVQLSFDNAGRLWVAVMPSYPHYKPGDEKPNDKLLILEDTDNDGKADKQTTFADGLHLPIGFEFAPEGVYVSQGTNLKLYTDTDGDDKADKVEIVFSGFDDHDTHHAISAFCADPTGAIYMAEGWFLHSNIETSYGTRRTTYGGFFRLDPLRRNLQRIAQINVPNPWSIAFDQWGQSIYSITSGPAVHWLLPGTIKPLYADYTPTTEDLIEEEHRVRPTSGMEFIYSRHFPPSVQGDFLINNTIGFLGMKQHTLKESGTGYESKFVQDVFSSDDKNFRPVDMEFAPDGSLYVVDWHNVLVGHMQHNARDPLRDHVHGRIYRVTYPSRPLVVPAKVAGAPIEVLLENLKLPEYRTRYRTRRELRGRNHEEVLAAITTWAGNLPKGDQTTERLMLEALWVTSGINQVDESILNQLLKSEDHKVRAAAVQVLRFSGHQVANHKELIAKAAQDAHGRVRLEAIAAASWLENADDANEILEIAGKQPMDKWIEDGYKTAVAHVNGEPLIKEEDVAIKSHLIGNNFEIYKKGKEIYERDGYCGTCHQHDGKGLKASGFPPLAGTKWVNQGDERLIKLTLKGLYGPIEVLGDKYPGQVPMTPYESLLNDEEISAVLTYVRNSFGNKSSVIYPGRITEIREKIADKKGFYSPEELLAEHPHRN